MFIAHNIFEENTFMLSDFSQVDFQYGFYFSNKFYIDL